MMALDEIAGHDELLLRCSSVECCWSGQTAEAVNSIDEKPPRVANNFSEEPIDYTLGNFEKSSSRGIVLYQQTDCFLFPSTFAFQAKKKSTGWWTWLRRNQFVGSNNHSLNGKAFSAANGLGVGAGITG
jgi:hypothetical protein